MSLLIFLGLSSPLWGNQEEVDTLKHQIATLEAHLHHVDLFYGGFSYVDSNFFRGAKGLVDQTERFHQKANDWINGWQALQAAHALLAQTTPGNLTSLTDKITERFTEQRKLWSEIQLLASHISALGRLIAQSYDEIVAPLEGNYAPQYRPIVNTLVSQLERMRQLALQIAQKSSGHLAQMEAVIAPSEHKFLEALKAALAAQGLLHLETAMKAAKEVLLLDKHLGGATQTMKALYEQGDEFSRRRMVFHLRRHLKTMEETASELKASAAAAGLSGVLLADVQNIIHQYLTEMRADLVDLEEDEDSKLVYRAARRLKRDFEQACESHQTQINCNLLNDLSKITQAQVEAMPPSQLENFEMAWDLVGDLP